MQIKVLGLASGKSQTFSIKQTDLELTVLNFLIDKKIPIAFSCKGQFICKKCKINEGKILACEITVKNIILNHNSEISIDYI